MADAATISSLATAGGTLVLAIATFSSVRSSNRSARVAERSLYAGTRPVLIPSSEDDPVGRVRFGDEHLVIVPGHGGELVAGEKAVYLAIGLRNGGAGVAVLHGWRVTPRQAGTPNPAQRPGSADERPELEDFRRQGLDIYITVGAPGYWIGALRDPSEPVYEEIAEAAANDDLVQVDLLYGDHEGGQRTIVRFVLSPWPADEGDEEQPEGRRAYVIRYWNVDRDDPR
jgi:hypothetical protein